MEARDTIKAKKFNPTNRFLVPTPEADFCPYVEQNHLQYLV